jgi:MtN3 and saliva related transmembrane protein
MDMPTLIGLLAGALTTVAFVPQVVKVYRSRSTGDISLSMYLIITTGYVLWLLYGILIASMPVILANIVTLVLAFTILVLKVRYR